MPADRPALRCTLSFLQDLHDASLRKCLIPPQYPLCSPHTRLYPIGRMGLLSLGGTLFCVASLQDASSGCFSMEGVTVWPPAVLCSCRDVIHDLDHDAGGCNICGRPDFALGAFCDRTMILCDQCECEFHVGCLRKAGRCDLSQLPTGGSSIPDALQPPSAASCCAVIVL